MGPARRAYGRRIDDNLIAFHLPDEHRHAGVQTCRRTDIQAYRRTDVPAHSNQSIPTHDDTVDSGAALSV